MTDKTHWKKLINPEFIGAYSLPEGQDLTVVIDYVQLQEITGTGGKKEDCTVAHLQGEKPMILNVTNSKSIAKLYGPFIEDWAGKRITLFASTTRLAGETVECLRIRPKVADRVAKPISDIRLADAIRAIKKGDYNTDKLRTNHMLSAAQEKLLQESLAADHA